MSVTLADSLFVDSLYTSIPLSLIICLYIYVCCVQALAKMRLSRWVLPSDVQEATRLVRVATQTAATDPRTGTIDM